MLPSTQSMASLSYLALGDSYTIGESVPIYDSFPYQAVQILRRSGKPFLAPEIIAKTGWTTDELMAGIASTQFLPAYDFVSLLIGVNNQYRGRELKEYETQFEILLKQAMHFAGDQPAHVTVISIPDWSVTPFANSHLPDAKGRDKQTVAGQIDAFNDTARRISAQYEVGFLDITTHTRESAGGSYGDPAGWIAGDGLHPSGKEYGHWAHLLAEKAGALF